jgi:hypothetical protein
MGFNWAFKGLNALLPMVLKVYNPVPLGHDCFVNYKKLM